MNDDSKAIIASWTNFTFEAVMNLKPGTALDALTAVKVMGWEVVTEDEEQPAYVPYIHFQKSGKVFYPTVADSFPELYPLVGMPDYSTNILAAWEVVQEMEQQFHWRITSPYAPMEKWFAGLTPHYISGWNGKPDIWVEAQSASEAICKAALLCKLTYQIREEK